MGWQNNATPSEAVRYDGMTWVALLGPVYCAQPKTEPPSVLSPTQPGQAKCAARPDRLSPGSRRPTRTCARTASTSSSAPTASPSSAAWPTRSDGPTWCGSHSSSPARRDNLCSPPVRSVVRSRLRAQATNPDYSSNPARVKNQAALDALISAWTGARSSRDVLAAMAVRVCGPPPTPLPLISLTPANGRPNAQAASVPAGPIYSVENMMVDPHYQARGMFETVDAGGQPLKVHGHVLRPARHPPAH